MDEKPFESGRLILNGLWEATDADGFIFGIVITEVLSSSLLLLILQISGRLMAQNSTLRASSKLEDRKNSNS
jgi:hypothetical protein